MTYPQEYIDYLVQFHGSRDYFECHEILEEYWKETDPRNKQSHWVGFILLAVSAYHHRRANLSGAERTARKSLEILKLTPSAVIQSLGLDRQKLLQLLQDSINAIEHKQPYVSRNLPISDSHLLQLCQSQCMQQNLDWQLHKDIPEHIIHRHTLRDRSEVILERERQKALRLQKKNHNKNTSFK